MDYKTYLHLPTLLSAQTPMSHHSHDEMFFIILHQTYELWFKQILFEMDRVQKVFSCSVVQDQYLHIIFSGLERINKILAHLVRQIDILETMTPLDFLEFRHVFASASGFQSIQFREIEIRFGLNREERIRFDHREYDEFLAEEDQKKAQAKEKEMSLFSQLEQWLERTPFLEREGYDFWHVYQKSVNESIDTDKKFILKQHMMNEIMIEKELHKLDQMQQKFNILFEEQPKDKWPFRLSIQALRAALFINLYRDQPALQLPFRILQALMELDETMTLWRFKHVLMVERMLGTKIGSGGSSSDYLLETIKKHRIFHDLFALSTFLVPRHKLPLLPKNIEDKMKFCYAI